MKTKASWAIQIRPINVLKEFKKENIIFVITDIYSLSDQISYYCLCYQRPKLLFIKRYGNSQPCEMLNNLSSKSKNALYSYQSF